MILKSVAKSWTKCWSTLDDGSLHWDGIRSRTCLLRLPSGNWVTSRDKCDCWDDGYYQSLEWMAKI